MSSPYVLKPAPIDHTRGSQHSARTLLHPLGSNGVCNKVTRVINIIYMRMCVCGGGGGEGER